RHGGLDSLTGVMPFDFRVQPGFPDGQRPAAAMLFWSAFRGKLETVMKPEARALAFFEKALDPDFAISAVSHDGTLLGLAGYKTDNGAFVNETLAQMTSVYGRFGGLWRATLLNLLEREPEPGSLLMDGIFVSEAARGKGVGTALLQAIFRKAAEDGLNRVRLDVIDRNVRARSLYERVGFRAVSEEHTGVLKHVFGFSSATRMEKPIP
ncbi:MAG: GNAT family N-acetyltransferase, partial [Pseudomonadota bacterium]